MLSSASLSTQIPNTYLHSRATWPLCLRAIADTATLTEEAAKIILGQRLGVLTPHQVQGVLEMKGHLCLTGNRLTRNKALLLGNPDVTVKTCNTLMPIESSPYLTHSCSETSNLTYCSRTDLLD